MTIEHRKNLFVGSMVLATIGSLAACQRNDASVDSLASELLGGGQLHGDNLPSKTVVLTYDDGPDEHTLELAKYLAENGVKATFFVNGSRLCQTMGPDGTCLTPHPTRKCNDGKMQANVAKPKYYPESILDQLLALGHRLGNHTQDHCHLPGQTNATDLAWEFKTTQDILDRHVCDGVALFRAPFGEWSGAIAQRLNSQMGMGFERILGPVNWEIDGQDWDCWQKGASPATCAGRYMGILNGRGNKNGIFLMHDRPEFNVGQPYPLEMTRILVPMLKAQGYKFGTMDDVLKLSPKDAGACPASPAPGSDAGAETAAPTDTSATTDVGTGGSGGGNGGAGGSPAVNTGGSPGSGGQGGTTINTGGAPTAATGGRSGSGTGGSEAPAPVNTSAEPSGGCSYSPARAPAPVGAALVLGLLLASCTRRRFRPTRTR